MGKTTNHKNYSEGTCANGAVVQYSGPRIIGGRLHGPAESMSTGTFKHANGDKAIVISMNGMGSGQYTELTPDGARQFARALIELAAEIDCHIAAQASAAIERSRTGGGA